jgi:5-methylthioadenosine/S-adenosylhomocysteine deaminase
MAWGPAGPQWVRDETWRRLAMDAAGRGVGIHFHLLESPAQAAAARRLYPAGTLAHLRALNVFAAPVSCAHAVHLSEEDRRIAAGEGLIAVLNPGSNMRLYNGAPAVPALREAGVALAVGTDNCALSDDEDLLAELRLAAALGRGPGIDAGEERRQDPGSVLAMATEIGARAAFLDPACGRLDRGAPADICALRLDGVTAGQPVAADRLAELVVARGRGADCILTVVAGQVRYRAGADDRARLEKWRTDAFASVRARAERLDARQTAALQAALAYHYASRT